PHDANSKDNELIKLPPETHPPTAAQENDEAPWVVSRSEIEISLEAHQAKNFSIELPIGKFNSDIISSDFKEQLQGKFLSNQISGKLLSEDSSFSDGTFEISITSELDNPQAPKGFHAIFHIEDKIYVVETNSDNS